MNLSINDRWAILNSLPKEANLTNGKQLRRLRHKLELSDSDLASIDHRFITCTSCGLNNSEHFSVKKCDTVMKEVHVNKWEMDIILSKFQELESSGKLPLSWFPIYGKLDPTKWNEDDDEDEDEEVHKGEEMENSMDELGSAMYVGANR